MTKETRVENKWEKSTCLVLWHKQKKEKEKKKKEKNVNEMPVFICWFIITLHEGSVQRDMQCLQHCDSEMLN